jgi:hypothetical protein
MQKPLLSRNCFTATLSTCQIRRSVTIHEFCNAHHLTVVDLGRNKWPRPKHGKEFPYEQTDLLVGSSGSFFVAINRVAGVFVAQTRVGDIWGKVELELTPELLLFLAPGK